MSVSSWPSSWWRILVKVMHGDMLVTHSLLATLLAYSKLNAKSVSIDAVSWAVQWSWKNCCAFEMPPQLVPQATKGEWDTQWVMVCSSAESGLSSREQDLCSPSRLGWSVPFWSHNFLFESDLESYEPNLQWLHSRYMSVGRHWGLAANSSGLRCGLATPYSPSEFVPLLLLYWRLRHGGWRRHAKARGSTESMYLKLKFMWLRSCCACLVFVTYSWGQVLCSFWIDRGF